MIFSGGLSYDKPCRRPSLTIMHGKAITVLEMDHPIVDFLTLCETPYPNGEFIGKNTIMKNINEVIFPTFHTLILPQGLPSSYLSSSQENYITESTWNLFAFSM